MPNKIERINSVTGSIALTASEATSVAIPYGAVGGGMVFVSALATGTKIVWHAASSASSAAVPVVYDDSAVETLISAGNAYPIPDPCFAAPFLKAVLDGGTATITLAVKG